MPEIEVRPATFEDISILANMDHSYNSEYVWQMDLQRTDSKSLTVTFREVRYPRPVRVEYPRSAQNLNLDWQERSGLLIASIAEETQGDSTGEQMGSLVGYISLSLGHAPSATWITDLAVRRRLRRQGIGSALLLAAQEWAANHECQHVVIEMQLKNHPAIKMAQKMGFDFYGFFDQYYKNGDIGLFFAKSLW